VTLHVLPPEFNHEHFKNTTFQEGPSSSTTRKKAASKGKKMSHMFLKQICKTVIQSEVKKLHL